MSVRRKKGGWVEFEARGQGGIKPWVVASCCNERANASVPMAQPPVGYSLNSPLHPPCWEVDRDSRSLSSEVHPGKVHRCPHCAAARDWVAYRDAACRPDGLEGEADQAACRLRHQEMGESTGKAISYHSAAHRYDLWGSPLCGGACTDAGVAVVVDDGTTAAGGYWTGSSGAVTAAGRCSDLEPGGPRHVAGTRTTEEAVDPAVPSSLATWQSAWLHAPGPQAAGRAQRCCGCRTAMQGSHGVYICNGGGEGEEMARGIPRSVHLSVEARQAVVPPPPVDARRAVRLRSMLFSLAAAHSAGDMVSGACMA